MALCLGMGFKPPTNALFHGGGAGNLATSPRLRAAPASNFGEGGTLKTSDHHHQAGLCLCGVHKVSCPASL